jgi:hypothetical protein
MKDIFGISDLELCRALSERIALEVCQTLGLRQATPLASVVWAPPAPKSDALIRKRSFQKTRPQGWGFWELKRHHLAKNWPNSRSRLESGSG